MRAVFAAGKPFSVTDVVIRPQDGHMYVTIGGRGGQSALYRITYQGKESTAPAASGSEGPAATGAVDIPASRVTTSDFKRRDTHRLHRQS
ncbi:MAG: hypothetical protein EBW14_22220 [Oxalobacteraceae bacterium]|nr:hypothetical protein [Oxalobacteraceae bacterium]